MGQIGTHNAGYRDIYMCHKVSVTSMRRQLKFEIYRRMLNTSLHAFFEYYKYSPMSGDIRRARSMPQTEESIE